MLVHRRLADEVPGQREPDEARGERVCAVVETAPGADPITFVQMADHCRAAGLMTQKIPEQLEVVEALPRDKFNAWVLTQAGGKVDGLPEAPPPAPAATTPAASPAKLAPPATPAAATPAAAPSATPAA